MTALSLAHLTVLSVPPPEMTRLAAHVGYSHVGLRLIAVTEISPGYPMMDDPAMLRATKAALRDTGIEVLNIEFVRITPETDEAVLERAIAVGGAGRPPPHHRPLRPDPARLADAVKVSAAAGRENAGILVDALHFDRSASNLADLDRLTARRLPFLHLCDAPAARPDSTEILLHQARAEHLPPAEGGLDLPFLIAHMPAGIPVVLEVPMAALIVEAGPEELVRLALASALRLLEKSAQGGPQETAWVTIVPRG
jgi:sugar phosphate isomerase/epimerase